MNSDKVRFNRRNKLRIGFEWFDRAVKTLSSRDLGSILYAMYQYTSGKEVTSITDEKAQALFDEWRESYEKWLNGEIND